MKYDAEIGRVVAVDTAHVSIELNHDLKGMIRNTYEGTQEVGRINSYVIIPVGTWRLVAMVTRVVLVEEAEMKADKTMITLPAARRLMKATLIGTITGRHFQQGVSIFPILDNPVCLAERADLDAIFGLIQCDVRPKSDKPGYCIRIGKSPIAGDRPVRIDPDAFFGKHAAILGSTGSGKSCTIATLLQSIHKESKVKRTTCVILDINGEYRGAFSGQNGTSNWKGKTLHIPSDPAKKGESLAIPYWFMNTDDFIRLFQAAPGTQRPVLMEALQLARNDPDNNTSAGIERSSDAPSYFDKLRLRPHYIKTVVERGGSRNARLLDYLGTMFLRIDRLLADRRFEFLFGPVGEVLPKPSHALATFIRDTLGIGAPKSADVELSNEEDVELFLPFYNRQREHKKSEEKGAVDIVIFDLSLLASEILENVTALIGRLILEFLQRLGEHDGGNARGSLPVVLVLEEAQNYIQQQHFANEESVSRDVFERIAREGRKYGLSLIVASQRPSELSKTVLSQCNSFIVHRLQNPEDLQYFRRIVPNIYEPMLEQMPVLAPQTALVLGECVPAPTLVKIDDAQPVPRSRDPQFYRYWTSDCPPEIKVESICSLWEGNSSEENPETEK